MSVMQITTLPENTQNPGMKWAVTTVGVTFVSTATQHGKQAISTPALILVASHLLIK